MLVYVKSGHSLLSPHSPAGTLLSVCVGQTMVLWLDISRHTCIAELGHTERVMWLISRCLGNIMTFD